MKKLIILFLLIFGLKSCGYSPIYSNNNDTSFEIYDLEIEGNEEVNDIIENKLDRFLNNSSEKKYIIKIKTDYEKISATKDRTGSTTHFKLIVNLELNFERVDSEVKGEMKKLFFSESLIINKNQDNFDQNNYEKITIKNISELLIDKVVLYLARTS